LHDSIKKSLDLMLKGSTIDQNKDNISS